MNTLQYFAYGSNLHPRWLRSRTPSAKVIKKSGLIGWRLQFDKQSHVDGSAKCNILYTGRTDNCVHGVIYQIINDEKSALDRAEDGYSCEKLYIPGAGKVIVYLAAIYNINPGLRPYSWYHDIVVAGAKLHKFPASYIKQLEKIEADPDPDEVRDRNHRIIVWPGNKKTCGAAEGAAPH